MIVAMLNIVIRYPISNFFLNFLMVGARGFEPPTSWSRTKRAYQTALRPGTIFYIYYELYHNSLSETTSLY